MKNRITHEELKPKRRKKPAVVVNEDTPFLLHPVPESIERFLQRREEVQWMLCEMIILARKKGRPIRK